MHILNNGFRPMHILNNGYLYWTSVLATTFTIIMTVITLKLYHQEGSVSCSTSYTGIIDTIRKRQPMYQTENAEGENYAKGNETIATGNHGSWK